jgi:hypothetical protein
MHRHRLVRGSIAATILVIGVATSVDAATGWTRESARIPATAATSMGYDAKHHQLILFGGQGSGGPFDFRGTTWRWTGSKWLKLTPPHHPSARADAMVAYDARRDQLILFGGQTAGAAFAHDTWRWTGSDWLKLRPAHHPRGRTDGSLAYHAGSGRLILFGGVGFSDTWAWNGTDWTRLNPAHHPKERVQASMATDLANNSIVLFGGELGHEAQTWTWSFGDWHLRHPVHSPVKRRGAAMTWDAGRKTVLLTGGAPTGADGVEPYSGFDDTWTWSGVDWTKESVGPSGKRFLAPMAYDADHQALVRYGGVTAIDNRGNAKTDPSTAILGS